MDRLKRLEKILGTSTKETVLLEKQGGKYVERKPWNNGEIIRTMTAQEVDQLQETHTVITYSKASEQRNIT